MTMPLTFDRPPRDALLFHVLPPRHGFHVYVFEQGGFPVSPPLLKRWLDLYSALRPLLFPANANTIALLQMWHIHHQNGAAVLAANGQAWQPDFGVGVWLDQPPPALWTAEEFEQLGPGDPVRPPIFSAIRLCAQRLDREAVWRSMGGRGCYMEFLVASDPETFLAQQAPAYQRWIEEEIIRAHPFFVPLVSAASLHSDLLASRLLHLDSVVAYARESQEDRGLLVLVRQPMEQRIAAAFRLAPCAARDRETRSFVMLGPAAAG
jgi:hypothetical protein